MSTQAQSKCMCVCLQGACAYLILFSTSLLIVFEDVVSDIILWVDQELLGLTLFIPPLHPHHKKENQHYKASMTEKDKETI